MGVLVAGRVLAPGLAGLALLATTASLVVAAISVADAGAATGIRAVGALSGAGLVLVGGLAAAGLPSGWGPGSGDPGPTRHDDPAQADPPPTSAALIAAVGGIVATAVLAGSLALGLPGLSDAERAWCLGDQAGRAVLDAGEALGLDAGSWATRADGALLGDRGFVRACRMAHAAEAG